MNSQDDIPVGPVRLRKIGIISSARILPMAASFCLATSDGSKLDISGVLFASASEPQYSLHALLQQLFDIPHRDQRRWRAGDDDDGIV